MAKQGGIKPAARGEDTPFFYFLCLYALVDKMHWILQGLREIPESHSYTFLLEYLPLSWDVFLLFLIISLALYGLVKGPSVHTLLLISTAIIIQLWLSHPHYGNPLLLCLFLVVLIVGSGVYLYFREGTVTREKMYALYAPAGRWLLLVMYFWGIFHKINTDYLNVDYSCASFLVRSLDYMVPFGLAEMAWVHYLAIYGTFVVEGLALVLLLIPSQRYYGRIIGILFHLLIGFAYFRDYQSFSLISIALHSLFVPAGSVEKTSALRIFGRPLPWSAISVCVLIFSMLLAFIYNAFLWGVLSVVVILWTVFFTRASPKIYKQEHFKRYFKPAVGAFLIIPLIYFLQCATPYVGLKTAQSLSMFSNLRTEGGMSNHYFFPKPLYLFNYQRDLVRITKMGDRDMPPGGERDILTGRPVGQVYYQFIHFLKENPGVYVEYQVNDGETRVYKGDGNIPDLDILLPYPLSKVFVFVQVALDTPPHPNACY